MKITFTIDPKRAPAVLAAVLALDPKPDKKDQRYVKGETDQQWVHRILEQRFRRTLVAIMKKAERQGVSTPDPGIPNGLKGDPEEPEEDEEPE